MVAILEQVLGPRDPEIAAALDRYALCLEKIGNTQKAKKMRGQADRMRSE